RNVCPKPHVQEHGKRAGQERDQLEIRDAEMPGRSKQRNRCEHESASDVGNQQDQATAKSIDPRARRERQSRNGANRHAFNTPNCAGVAFSASTAVKGRARPVTSDPKSDTVSPPHSSRKS